MTERRSSARYAVVLPALWSRFGGAEIHAVTVDISSDGIRLRSASIPHRDEALTCNIRGVGQLTTRVTWASSCEFALRVTGQTPTPSAVAMRLIELGKRQAKPSASVRVGRRIVPSVTAVQVGLEDGGTVAAQIINISASGVALQVPVPLAIGQSIVVGARQATVARRLENGVGAVFLVGLDPDAIDESTVL